MNGPARAFAIEQTGETEANGRVFVRVRNFQKAMKEHRPIPSILEEAGLNFTALALTSGLVAGAVMGSGMGVADDEQMQMYEQTLIANFRSGVTMAIKKAAEINGSGGTPQ